MASKRMRSSPVRQRRGRLVQDQDAYLAHQRLANLGHLPERKGQAAHDCPGIERDSLFVEKALRLGQDAALFKKPEASARLAAEQQIVGDRQRFNETQVLVDDRDPRFARLRGRGEADLLTSELNQPLVVVMDPAQDLDQCRLAGAIPPEKRVNFAGQHLEIHVSQGRDAAETLGNAPDANKGRG